MANTENTRNIRLGKRLLREIWFESLRLADEIVACQDGRKLAEMRAQFNVLVDMLKTAAQ